MCIVKVFQSNLYKLKWEKSNFCKLMYYTLHSWLLCICRYNSPIIESIIAMILIDILDVTVRYWIDNDCDRDLAEIQIELSTETLKRTEYLTIQSSSCIFYFKNFNSAVSTVRWKCPGGCWFLLLILLNNRGRTDFNHTLNFVCEIFQTTKKVVLKFSPVDK